MSDLKIEAAALSDIGLVRKRNEDNFFFNGKIMDGSNSLSGIFGTDKAVFAVCDGMGGIDNGDVASLISVKALSGMNGDISDGTMGDKLKKCIADANESICAAMKKSKNRMGSTLATIAINKDKMCVVNVGDSRVYSLRDGKLEQLTVDHTETQFLVKSGLITLDEAQIHPHRNRLTQHLGLFPDEILIEPYISDEIELTAGARYLICSDGLYGMIDEEKIKEILGSDSSSQSQCEEFIKASLDSGGKDNVTALVLHVDYRKDDEEVEDAYEFTSEIKEEQEEKVNFLKEICDSKEKKFFIIRYIILIVVLAIVFTIAAVAMNKNIDKRVGPDGYLVPVTEIQQNN